MRGMRARSAGDGEHDDAALQLGTMLEHLAKAYLASLHPTLILEDRFDLFSTLQQVGLGHRGKPGHVLKTVGIYEALTRIGIIQSPSTPGAGKAFAARFERVLQARNGVAHAGQDGGWADEVAQLAIQGAEELLAMMNHQLKHVFGDYTAAAVALRDEHATKVRQQVTLLIARSKRAFHERYGDVSDADQAADLAALDRITTTTLEHEHNRAATTCPACGHVGILSGLAELEWNTSEDLITPGGLRLVTLLDSRATLSPDSFRCPACGLRLSDREQLFEAHLDSTVELGPTQRASLEAFYGEMDAEIDAQLNAERLADFEAEQAELEAEADAELQAERDAEVQAEQDAVQAELQAERDAELQAEMDALRNRDS